MTISKQLKPPLAFPALLALLAAVMLPVLTRAQDPVFSQPYISPVYLNPAATGAGTYDYQVSVVHRLEWLTIPSQFNYTALSASHFMPSIKSGVGLLATDFSEGYLKTTALYGNYSYSICTSDENSGSPWIFTGALQFGMAQTAIDYSQLVFADQLNQDGYIPGSISAADIPIYNKRWYPDFAGGLLVSNQYPEDHFLVFGASAYHFNRPDQSLTATSDTFRSQLPVRWSASISYQVMKEHDWNWSVNLLWYHQQQATTWQLGVEIRPSEYSFSVGFWGHFGSNFGDPNAIGLTIMYDLTAPKERQSFKVAATEDFPVGGNGLSYTTGSSQLGMLWQYDSGKGDKDNRCQPTLDPLGCPKNK
jgi:type IX secretion system PorP/SprF family membrane protein